MVVAPSLCTQSKWNSVHACTAVAFTLGFSPGRFLLQELCFSLVVFVKNILELLT